MSEITSQTTELFRNQAGRIHARIIDEKNGLKSIDDVIAVRVHSKKYRLLIMEDYSPTIGNVDGDITIVTKSDEQYFNGIHAFYTMHDNTFTLLIDWN